MMTVLMITITKITPVMDRIVASTMTSDSDDAPTFNIIS